MKKFVVIVVALFLAIPTITYAGSVTSRYDVAIGGYIGIDFGWIDQLQGGDYTTATRDSYMGTQVRGSSKGNFYASGANSRLNFLVKGPDGWGAKTSAFIEGDFRGITGTPRAQVTNYGTAGVTTTGGTFSLRHAFMKMDWPKTSLTIGHTWQRWGYMPTYSNILLSYNGLSPFLRGTRQPQISINQNLTKDLSIFLGIFSPTDTLGNPTNATVADQFSASQMPFIEYEVAYQTDKLGKIGPWDMRLAIGGFTGKSKHIYANPANTGYGGQDVKSWGVNVKGFLPIIAEKSGNKTGALSISGNAFTGQNLGWYLGSSYVAPYDNDATALFNYSNPVVTGGWIQGTYFITDKLFATAWWGQFRYNFSDAYRRAAGFGGTNSVQYLSHMIFNLSYDVNPAVRFGAEYARIHTAYAGFTTGAAATGLPAAGVVGRQGHANAFRVGAWYFF